LKYSQFAKLSINPALLFKRALVLLLLSAGAGLSAQETLSAYEIMDKVDARLKYPDGLSKFQITITARNGSISVTKGSLYQKEDSSLFLFDSISRGRELKLLYTDRGFNTYAYFFHDKKLYHKRDNDRFESVLYSSFNYQDLGNLSLLDNFTPRINGYEEAEGKQFLRIENIPLDKGLYSKLNILVDPSTDYSIYRMDYYDRAGIIIKSMEVEQRLYPVKTSQGSESVSKFISVRSMVDMNTGRISTFELLITDKTARLDESLFKPENIEK